MGIKMFLEKYCRKCNREIAERGTTMYEGKEICECDKQNERKNI